MPLSIGDKLGHYEVLSLLGQGGMGAVYRATDTKLGRQVAIKVLPEALAGDRDRLARFTLEARVLASLNHPNIAQIYCVEERALIMELVEGHDLRGPLPMATALNYARQIAEALEAAHEKGIVHRDLKPANVRITPDGVVKVLDFGLAAVIAGSAGNSDPTRSPTLTMATRPGMIMGTAAYMSPAQASGKMVDRRADIWSFGVVMWELLTGHRLFEGETVSHTLAGVLAGPIDFDIAGVRVSDFLQNAKSYWAVVDVLGSAGTGEAGGLFGVTTTVTITSGVPEPSTWAMMFIGFAGLGLAGYRKARSARTALSAA